MKIIIAVATVLGVIIVAAIVGFIILRRYRRNKAMGSVNGQQPKRDGTLPIRSSDVSSHTSVQAPPAAEDDLYEPQYHPKVELGNLYLTGGRLQVKVNEADDIAVADQDSNDTDNSEGEDEQSSPNNNTC